MDNNDKLLLNIVEQDLHLLAQRAQTTMHLPAQQVHPALSQQALVGCGWRLSCASFTDTRPASGCLERAVAVKAPLAYTAVWAVSSFLGFPSSQLEWVTLVSAPGQRNTSY